MTDEVILKVENLCQYFKLGNSTLKAVDNVSFELRKGEVFGIVGESGCGKTTTGRGIIRLYNITSGNVWFKGQRIGAGTLSYKNTIEKAKTNLKKQISEYRSAEKNEIGNGGNASDIKAKYAALINEYKKKFTETVAEEKVKIKLANTDQKKCDRIYVAKLIGQIEEEYVPKLREASNEQRKKLKKVYHDKLRAAKKTRLTTQIQMIFQDPIASLDPRMTVREIISEGLIIRGVKDRKFIDSEVYRMLEIVGLVKEHAGRYPHEFSGGQRQRIGIARSIIVNPDLIIADEPISALDVSIRAQVINLLNDLRNKLGLTIMFIAHDLSVVKYFSDTIGVMYFGKMVERAPSDEIFAHPLHPYTKSLLSAIPLPDPIYEKSRKRTVYNPAADHDYSKEQPTFREVSKDHFVLCNTAEFEEYWRQLEQPVN